MKKTASIILAAFMSLSLAATAFAGPADVENVEAYGYKGNESQLTTVEKAETVTSGSDTFEDLTIERAEGPTFEVSGNATAIVRDSFLATTTDENPLLENSKLKTTDFLTKGDLKGIMMVDQAQLYLINTSVFSDIGIALCAENGTPAVNGDTELSVYLYGSAADAPVAGIGAATGLLGNLYAYGSYILGAEIGLVSDTYGKITLGNAADGAKNKALSKVLKQSDKDALDAKTETIVEGGRNALVVHSSNPKELLAYEGYSEKELPLMSAEIKATNTTFRVDPEMDMEVPYKESEQAYIDHTKGSVILVKSTNADINLKKCELEAPANGAILQTVPTNETKDMNKVPDGKTYDGVKVFMKSMTVEGDVIHEDYQRDLKLTLSGTKLTGSVNGYDFASWKQTAKDEGFKEYCVDKKYKTAHGAEVSLIKGSTWEVSERSELTRLNISKDSMVVGEIYVNGAHVVNEPKEFKGEIVVLPAGSSIPETHTHYYWEASRKNPSCGVKGSVTYMCDCGDSYTEDIAALTHNYVRANGGSPAECDIDGFKPYYCTNCGDTYNEILKAPGHVYVYQKTVEPTCEYGGYDVWVCNQCGDKDLRNTTSSKMHEMLTDPSKSYAAGCMTDAFEYLYCKNCPYFETWFIEGTARGYHMYELSPDWDNGMQDTYHVNICRDCGHREGIQYGHFDSNGSGTCVCGWVLGS